MKTLRTIFAALPLLALLLTACTTAPPPVKGIDTAQFIALTERSPCAAGGNRLFVINEKYVYWDRDTACPDQVQRLYGNSAGKPLCIHANSINGPYTNCNDPSVRTLFDTILGNRQIADLGLGASDTVVQLKLVPPDNVNLAFTTVAMNAFSGIRTPRQVVVKDAAAWASLWAEHTATITPAPPLPEVDFNTQMLVGVFAGDLKGCHEFEIKRVNVAGGSIVVDYEDRDITAQTICIAAITNPMHVVAIPRIDAEVKFKQIMPAPIDFITIDRSPYSGVQEPQQVVIKDLASWTSLWHQHAGAGSPVPAVDFSISMVIAVFRGVLPNGCYSTEITDVYRVDSVINVHRIDTEPGEGAICTLAIVTPAHLIVVPRSNDPVVFSAERKFVP